MTILWIHTSSGPGFFAIFDSKDDAYSHVEYLIANPLRKAEITMMREDFLKCPWKIICVAASTTLQFIIVEDGHLRANDGILIEMEQFWLDVLIDAKQDDIFFTNTDEPHIVKLDELQTGRAIRKTRSIC